MEAITYKTSGEAYSELTQLHNTTEVLLLQTCNRIELYIITQDSSTQLLKNATEHLIQRAAAQAPQVAQALQYSINHDALLHLLRVASGLESMVIGEDQIVNQMWDAYLQAEKAHAAGPILKHLFNRAVNVGLRVRKETGINKGAVSVGSAAVELAESLLGSLNDKQILVLGAGETATLVAKAMARRCLRPIFLANRTYERAARLAEELSGQAIRFDKLPEVLSEADLVFCCTAAPHYLLTKDTVAKRASTKDLIIIDLSNPRNVEQAVNQLPHVKLRNIDDLTLITEKNLQERQKNIVEAEKILSEEIIALERSLKAESVRSLISQLLSQTEAVRQRELLKALNMMSDLDEREQKIVADLTSSLLKQTFLPVVENLRQAAIDGNEDLLEVAEKIFENKKPSRG
jgi:glutamyl-tRNA reductase